MHNPMILVWLCFLAGGLLSVMAKASISTQSPLNGIRNLRHYFAVNGWLVALRLFAGSMLFWITVLNMDSPPWPPYAGLAGVGIDSSVDMFIAKMGWQKIVPPVGGTVSVTEEKTTVTEATAKTVTVESPESKGEK